MSGELSLNIQKLDTEVRESARRVSSLAEKCGLALTLDSLSLASPRWQIEAYRHITPDLENLKEQLSLIFEHPQANSACGRSLECLEYIKRIEREIGLITATLERQVESSRKFYSEHHYSELERKADHLERSVHYTYLQGLQRKLLNSGIDFALVVVTGKVKESVNGLLGQIQAQAEISQSKEIDSIIHIRSQKKSAYLSVADESLNQKNSNAIMEKLQKEELDQALFSIESDARVIDKLKLNFALLASNWDSDTEIPSTPQQVVELLSKRGLLSTNDTIRLRRIFTQGNTPNNQERVVTTIDTASLPESARLALAEKMVVLINSSLTTGGHFMENDNNAPAFFQAFSVPGTSLHCIRNQQDELLAAAQVHLGEFPGRFSVLRQQYHGSLDVGFLRVVVIHPSLQGTDCYDQLDERVVLNAAGKVDFLVGRLRIGSDFNDRGVRHIKAGHQPLGHEERSENGKLFQHLVVPVNSCLRKTIEYLKPKGYNPPVHRSIGAYLKQLSVSNQDHYQTPNFAETYLLLSDPHLALYAYSPLEFLKQHYSEFPEGLDPRHLLYRFRS
jgi:hypothetical protein